MKLCKDCKYYKSSFFFNDCRHPKNLMIDLVNGDSFFRDSACYLRKSSFHCGQNGNWFEKKESFGSDGIHNFR